jgi:hypothetical protein
MESRIVAAKELQPGDVIFAVEENGHFLSGARKIDLSFCTIKHHVVTSFFVTYAMQHCFVKTMFQNKKHQYFVDSPDTLVKIQCH